LDQPEVCTRFIPGSSIPPGGIISGLNHRTNWLHHQTWWSKAGWWYTYPSEKYESHQLNGKIKFMFQTTNQWWSKASEGKYLGYLQHQTWEQMGIQHYDLK
jgi:hypothetical protein